MPLINLLLFLIRKLQFSAFLVLIIVLSVSGQGKNFSINKKEPSWIIKIKENGAKPPAKDISDGYYLSLWEDQNHAELKQEYVHVIREIVSGAGVQNGSQITVTYDPSFQKLIFHKVILWRNNKPSDQLYARKFKVLQNEKDLSKFIYSGTYDAFLLVDDVRKGDRIEYAYTLDGENPIFGKKIASQFYFEGESSIGQIYTNLFLSKDRTVNFKNFNFNENPKKTEKDGLNIYEWESKLTKTHRVTDFEPAWYNPLRRTQLSEYKNWNEVVNWALTVNGYPNLKTPLLDKKVTELIKKAGSNKKKYIELAIRFVQDEIRYMGIEIGSYSHRPNSPEQVIKQRYGDCKDKSLLLCHLLSAQNIDAYMAYVNTYNTIKTHERLPSPFAFNHVVVQINYNHNKIWVDPTTSYQRGTLDNLYFPDYGDALVIKKGVNALEEVVSIASGKLISNLTFNLADTIADKKSTLIVKSVYTDNYADNIRSEVAESGTDGLEKSYLEYYAKMYPDIETAAPLKITDNEETNTLEITESYQISNTWADENNDRQFYVYGDMINYEMRNITAKNRLAPLSLKHPVNLEQIVTVNMPYLYNFGTESFKIENDNYYFELYRFQRGKTLTFNYTFRNMKSYIEGSKVKQYIKDRDKIKNYLTYHINRKASAESSANVNAYMLCGFLLLIIISSFLFFKIYQQREEFDLEKIISAKPINGWLILLAIRVITTPLSIFVKPIALSLFSSEKWLLLDGMENPLAFIFKLAFIINMIAFAVLLNYAITCMILFFNRRESFPRLYILFSKFYIGYSIFNFLTVILLAIKMQQPFIGWVYTITWLLSIGYSVLWIVYLKRSQLVKEVFVFTYPEIEWTKALSGYYHKKRNQVQENAIASSGSNNKAELNYIGPDKLDTINTNENI